MKHWDERERTDGKAVRLSPAEQERLRALLAPPAHRARVRADAGSVIGLALALAVLAGLAIALGQSGPVSPEVLP